MNTLRSAWRIPVKILWAPLTLLIILSGCASKGGPPAANPSGPAAATLPPITVVRTGGIAGVRDTLTITSTGAWTLTNKAGAARNGQLDAATIAALTTAATDPKLLAEAATSRPPTICRDAFNYDVTVAGRQASVADCPSDPDYPTNTIALVKMLFTAAGN